MRGECNGKRHQTQRDHAGSQCGTVSSLIIEELKRQENDAMEVVCIDDGSADGSPAVLDAIDDPHFVVIHQANAGVAAARNHGLDVARGEYLCFIDPDDHISDGYITALTNAAEAGRLI